MPKKKLKFFLIFSELPQISENDGKNEIKNEINFNQENIINIEENENKININIDDMSSEGKKNKFDDNYFNKQFEKDFKLFNIIPHFFYINDNE